MHISVVVILNVESSGGGGLVYVVRSTLFRIIPMGRVILWCVRARASTSYFIQVEGWWCSTTSVEGKGGREGTQHQVFDVLSRSIETVLQEVSCVNANKNNCHRRNFSLVLNNIS